MAAAVLVASSAGAEISCMLLAATRDLDRFAACSELFQPALGIPNTGQTRLKTDGREAGTLIRGEIQEVEWIHFIT
jgi:hypothetical protein